MVAEVAQYEHSNIKCYASAKQKNRRSDTLIEPPSLHQYLYRCEERKEDRESIIRSQNKS